MSSCKKSSMPRQSSYNSLYVNPLNELKHSRSCSEGGGGVCSTPRIFTDNKENAEPNRKQNEKAVFFGVDKENVVPANVSASAPRRLTNIKSFSTNGRVLKPSSLQFCMQMNEPDKSFGSKIWDPAESETSSSLKIWDYSDSEAAPASSWSTLPNRLAFCIPFWAFDANNYFFSHLIFLSLLGQVFAV
jgi:tubby-related protein 1